jgi:hypothetical protein
MSDLLAGHILLERAIFEAERVCDTGGAIPVAPLVRARDMSNAWSSSATLLFGSVLISGDPLIQMSKHPDIERVCVSMASVLVCLSLFLCVWGEGEGAGGCEQSRQLRSLFLSGSLHADLWHQASVVGRSCFSLSRPGPSPHSRLGPRDVSVQSHTESWDERMVAHDKIRQASRQGHREAGRR